MNQLIWHVLASTVISEFFSLAAVSKDIGWTLQVVLEKALQMLLFWDKET